MLDCLLTRNKFPQNTHQQIWWLQNPRSWQSSWQPAAWRVTQEWRELCLDNSNSSVQGGDFKSSSPFLPLRDTIPWVGDPHSNGAVSYYFIFCSLTKNAIIRMLTPKMLTSTLMKMKFQQVLTHVPFFAKDHCRLCHPVHRLVHSLEFQADTWCDPTGLY